MEPITLAAYYMGRDKTHAAELTDELRGNAERTVGLHDALLEEAAADDVYPSTDAVTGSCVASGWRPKSINDATSNAGKHSRHLTCEACDTRDATRALARWCLRNLDVLARLGLWMEDPRWTPTWVHLQTVAPASGHRVYVPSSNPPTAPPLPEQGT